jgi:hypothetical protein
LKGSKVSRRDMATMKLSGSRIFGRSGAVMGYLPLASSAHISKTDPVLQ